jgi:hypothetical protein
MVSRMDGGEGDVVERATLLADGYTDKQLRVLRRTGELSPVRPGAYLKIGPGEVDLEVGSAARHRATVLAAARRLAPGSVISHISAAVLHDLPLWLPSGHQPTDRVQVTRDRRTGARRSPYLDLHSAALHPDDVVGMDGLLVTSVARTVVDLARSLPFERALIPADAALHQHRTTPAELALAIERGAHRPGNAAARRLVAFADAGAESPGESRSRVAIAQAGLPAPRLQYDLRVERRSWRVDFWWEQARVVGEFDGRSKYGRALAPGGDPGEAVFAEKRREDALRAAGCSVIRWTWADLADFAPIAKRLRQALTATSP